jgi:hypothetical protein
MRTRGAGVTRRTFVQLIASRLAGLDAHSCCPPHQPFSTIASLHFASIVVFERSRQSQVLVFESNFDRELVAFIEAASPVGATT